MPKNSPEQIIDRPYDTSLRRGSSGTASSGSGGGATTFTGLSDTPSSYAGEEGAVLVANATATALEFGAVATATPTADAIIIADADGKIGAGWIDDADINLDNVTEGTTNKFYTATEKTKLAGIETAADVTDAGNIASSITGVSTDDTIVDADVWGYLTGGALVKTAWSNIKAVLKTYFDTLYNLYVHPNHSGDVTSVADGAQTIAADAVTFAKMQNIVTDSLIGRDTTATGDPENITLNATLSMTGAGALQRAALTGDVSASAGSNTTAIGTDKVLTAMILDAQITLAKMANLAQATIIGRASGAGTGVPTALTAAQVVAIIQSSIDHGGLAGLSDDDHTQYALLAGRASSQVLSGGNAANEDLTLRGTAHATKTSSYVLIQDTGGNTGIYNNTAPTHPLSIGAPETPVGTAAMIGVYNAGNGYLIFRDTTNDIETAVGTTTSGSRGYVGTFTNHPFAILVNNSIFALNVATDGNITLANGKSLSADILAALDASGLTLRDDGANLGVFIEDGGEVGIRQAVPTASIDVLQPTLGSAVYKLSSTATNDDPAEIGYHNRVTTTDATVTTLHTFTVPSSTSYMVEVTVIARRTGGVAGAAEDGAGYRLLGLYKNTAGTVAIIGAVVQTVVGESQAGWDATLDTTGATVRVRVTGAVNNNVTWHMAMGRTWQVAS